MKKMKVLLMLTLLSGFYVLPIVAHTKEEVADPKETIESKVEDQASEYFKAILNEDYKTVVKYVHPNVVNDLGDKDAVIELLKLGVDALKEEGMEVVSVSITGIEIIEEKETGTTNFVNHKTTFKTPDGDAEFAGKMKVYTFEGKNYFINSEGLILDSLGIKEFEDEEEPDLSSIK